MPSMGLAAKRGTAVNTHEESAMNRSISLSLTLAVALASQVALGGCSKKEDVTTPPVDTAASASAPDLGASGTMGMASSPMDSISSASAVAGSEAASAASR
jgi:hypothetical protein